MATLLGPDMDVYLTVAQWPTMSNWDAFCLFARVQIVGTYTPNDLNLYNGYCLQAFYNGSGSSVNFSLIRVDDSGGNSGTQLGSDVNINVTNGDAFGLRVLGSTITAYRKPSGGSWTQILTATDSTYSGQGFAGWYTPGNFNNNSHTGPGFYDDFGAGTITGTTFPEAAVVDSFTRADSTTLGTNWEVFMGFGPYTSPNNGISSNQATNTEFQLTSPPGAFLGQLWAGSPPIATPVSFTPTTVVQAGTCNPQSTTSNGGKGAAGCNAGGTGGDVTGTSSYSGPYGTVPQHADITEGELLTGKTAVDVWMELIHQDYPTLSNTTYRRAGVPLADLNTYEGGYKPQGLDTVGVAENAIGNEVQAYEATSLDISYSDFVDRLIRDLLDTQDLELDEVIIKMASPARRAAGGTPRIMFRGVVQQPELNSPMMAKLTAIDQLHSDYGPLGPNRKWPRLIPKGAFPGATDDTLKTALPWIYGVKSDNGATDPVTGKPSAKGVCPLIYCGQESISRTVANSTYPYGGVDGLSVFKNAGCLAIPGTTWGTTLHYPWYSIAAVFADGSLSGTVMQDNTLRFPGHFPEAGPPYDERIVWDMWDPNRTDVIGFIVFQYDAETNWDAFINPYVTANPRYKFVPNVPANPPPVGPVNPGVIVGDGTEPWAYFVDWTSATDGSPWPPAPGSTTTTGEVWDVYLVAGHPIFRMLSLYGTDNGGGDTTAKHDRIQIGLTARNGTDILIPWQDDGTVSPYWPFPTTYREYTDTDGRTYWFTVIYVKPDSPLSVDHKAGTVTMAANVIGVEDVGDGTGLPLIDLLWCEQHWLENAIIQDWTAGLWATLASYPQWEDGTPKVKSSSFTYVKGLLNTKFGGRLVASWYVDKQDSVSSWILQWNQSTDGTLGNADHGQLIVWALDENTDASAWPVINHVTDIFGLVKRVPGQARENAVSGACDWDPDFGKFRSATQTFSSPSGVAKYKGNQKTGDSPLDSTILAVTQQHAFILKRRLSRLQFGLSLIEVTGGIGWLDYDVGDGVLLTSIEGTGPGGYVNRPCVIMRRQVDLSQRPLTVTYTLWDISEFVIVADQQFIIGNESLSTAQAVGNESLGTGFVVAT